MDTQGLHPVFCFRKKLSKPTETLILRSIEVSPKYEMIEKTLKKRHNELMKKEEQIKYLKEFVSHADKWFSLNNISNLNSSQMEKAYKKNKNSLSIKWGVVEEILKSLDINYKGEIFDRQSKRTKNGNFFIDGFIGIDYYPVQISNLEKLKTICLGAIEKLKTGFLVRANILPDLSLLLSILNSTPDVIGKWKHRRQGKDTVEIKDEYDIQDFLYAMLRGAFPTLQYENPTKKTGLTSNIADFTIEDLGLFLEVKYIANQQGAKRAQKECKEDIISYGKQDTCNKIIFFIYDPNKCIANQYAFSVGLGDKFSDGQKNVEIITKIIN